MNAPPKDLNAPSGPMGAARYIGARVPRKEDGRLLTGKGTFVDDVVLPGMLHIAFVRSPMARGLIKSIDTSMAETMPGVEAVYTQKDLDKVPCTLLSFFLVPVELPVPLLARDYVCYVGDPVVMIVAKDRYLAEDAASMVVVDYEEQDPVVTIADAMREGAIHPGTESNCAQAMGIDEDEDLEEVLANAPYLLTGTIKHGRISQSPMETRGCVAQKQGIEELVIYITCQSPHMIERVVRQSFGFENMSIRVIAKDVGGSFGLKNSPWREELATVAAAMLLDRPVKWIEDRWENLVSANQAREQEMTTRIAFEKDGTMIAAHSDYHSNNGAYPQGADANIAVHMFMWAAYKMPQPGFYTRAWYTNTVGLAAYRGPWAMESLARETLLDKAARGLGIDPVELRRKNLLRLSDQPTVTPMGLPIEDITPAECLDKLVENFDIPAFRKEQAEARKEGRYLGLGIAAYIEPTGSAGSMAPMTGELAQVRIEPNGKVTALMSTHSQGHGTQTTMAQVVADTLGVPYEDVTVFEGDSSRGGFGPGASGSRQGVIGSGASMKATALLRDKVKTVAAHLLNANEESITIANGMVHVTGSEEMSRSLAEIAAIAYGEPARLPPDMEPGLEAQFRYQPPPMTMTSAAHACVVEVDPDTGFVKILRWIASEDCGVVINPAVVEGQVAGGLAQAIGSVLLEEVHYDKRGNPTTVTYKDYLLPSISDVPNFEYIHANTPAQNPVGVRGVGEGGAIVGPPTLFNAIADALSPFGDVPIELPLTPTKILGIIEGRDLGGGHHDAPLPETAADEPVADADAAGASAALAGLGEGGEAPVRLDGEWAMVLASPVGDQHMTGRFQTDGEAVTGSLESPEGSQDFTGTLVGDRLKFDLKVSKPMPMTLKYDITLAGDEMTGKVKLGMFGTAPVTAKRVGGEEAAPAAPAPVAEEAPAVSEPKLDGEWAMVLASPVGDQFMTGRFQTDGEAVTGALESPEGSQDFTGTLVGDRLKFDLKVSKPMPMTLKYDITLAGDEMSGKVKLGMFGTAPVTGKRVGGEEAAPAAPAPVTEETPAVSEPKLDGEWAMVLASPVGDQHMTGRFQTDGEAVTGSLESPEGSQDFTGTLVGDRLKFDLKVSKPMPMTLKYDITLAGDDMSGKVKLGMFGTAPVTGKRVGGEETAVATEIPAPAVEEASAPVAPKLDGEWAMVLAAPVGDQHMTGRFQTDGEAVTGSLESPEGSQDFTGTLVGDRLKFDLKVTKPMPMTLKYDITLAGDEFAGKVKLGMFGTAPVTGKRVG